MLPSRAENTVKLRSIARHTPSSSYMTNIQIVISSPSDKQTRAPTVMQAACARHDHDHLALRDSLESCFKAYHNSCISTGHIVNTAGADALMQEINDGGLA